MNRLLVASTTRHDIDLPKYMRIYEFSEVPFSLLTPGDLLYYLKDKATITTELWSLQAAKENESVEEELGSNARKVIVIDGMDIVKRINILNSQIRNYDDIIKCFTDMRNNETEDLEMNSG